MADAAAPATIYACRASLFESERTFKLTPDSLIVAGGQFDFRDIERVRLYRVRAQNGDLIKRCKVHGAGRAVRLQSAHIAKWGTVQDRSAQFGPFVHELLVRIAHANPGAIVLAGMPRATRAGWLLVVVMVAGLAVGGLVQVASGEWEGLWLIGMAFTTAPLAVTMSGEKPSRQMRIKDVASTDGRFDWFG